MNTFITNYKTLIKPVGICFIALMISMIFIVKTSKASTSLSGSCGAMMSLDSVANLMLTYQYGSQTNESTSVDAMIIIDFDNKKIFINRTKANFESINPNFFGTITYSTNTMTPIDLSISDGPLPNSFLLSAPINTIPNLILLPVNSGNTFLIQAKDSKATGICQKV